MAGTRLQKGDEDKVEQHDFLNQQAGMVQIVRAVVAGYGKDHELIDPADDLHLPQPRGKPYEAECHGDQAAQPFLEDPSAGKQLQVIAEAEKYPAHNADGHRGTDQEVVQVMYPQVEGVQLLRAAGFMVEIEQHPDTDHGPKPDTG